MRLVYFALMFTLLMAPLPAQADMVLDWNEFALQSIRNASSPPPVSSRALAITHAAIYDSVNSIYKTNQKYYTQLSGYTTASPAAAVAAAGYTSLLALYPGQAATLLANYTASLITIPDTPAKTLGISLGQQVANTMLTLRSTDGWNTVYNYTPTPGAGNWKPTPPANAPFLLPQWGDVTPFAMTSNTQFYQYTPPPLLTSAEYTAAFNEVKEKGAAIGSTRTPDQTNIALFWADGGGTETPPGHWNSIAQTVATSQNTTLAENARLFALLNLAEADAAIASWLMKRDYSFWRPITGIREADTDGNNDTLKDEFWTPLITTPPFPSYVSGHSTFSGAGSAVLKELFGDGTAFSSTADNGITRNFSSFSQAAAEAGMSRIYGGIHWQFDNVYGLKAGDDLGKYVSANYLTAPLPGTLAMSLTGLGAMLLAAWRRRR
jgi:hypothetical protein